ncbi:MAG: ATP-binding cassette domain-containing protein [Phenylobacterium sp.]|uniref:ATP-binding cassette domain-containing protein n=1 Tax=Phenylobacterium sp. TaxID=1871053 RepID=UPI001A55BC8C|nr:ATP-binding cassette domain-containing protein [Phenylobacterium sp.]MBL8771700.1 ATP-binding cassette domain-containing protein [Phenylobacterium sp.]
MTQGAPKGRYLAAAPLDAEAAAAVGAVWWPIDRLGEGLAELARRSGVARTDSQFMASQACGEDPEALLPVAAGALGLEAEPVDVPAGAVADMLRQAAPAIALVRQGREMGFVLLLGASGRTLRVLGPDLAVSGCPVEALRACLCWSIEGGLAPRIAPILDDAGLTGRRRRDVGRALMADRLASERVGGVWLLREPAGASMGRQALQMKLPWIAAAALGIFGLLYAAEMLGWSLIGRSVLDGRLDFGWFTAWLLLLATLVPLRFAGGALEARIAVDLGRRLKARLLAGALKADPDAVGRQGFGQVIGRVMESQALESLALNGGLAALIAVLELAFAALALAAGAAAGWHLALLAGFAAALAVLGHRFHRRMRSWTLRRLALSQRMIEAMVGHRTRLAQERPTRRDAAEDADLRAYLAESGLFDRAAMSLLAVLPTAWLVAGVAGLAPAFAGPHPPTPAALAISLGGVLLAQRGLFGLVTGLAGLSRAGIAWTQVADLARGDACPEPEPLDLSPTDRRSGGAVLRARGLAYAYAKDAPVLAGVDLTLHAGDRVLLEGGSGGGKSTLTALLSGLRKPTRGALSLNGLDHHTLGAAWRRGATAAPQFNDNHLLSGSLAFNLLMGRRWPATAEDLAEAEALCRELDLGALIDRMPAGLHQPVGETGWQLSHGERSRVFLARALLQGADLTILDESFAALDPETLRTCLATASRRTNTLVVVAHP